jgi:hypothetical protein
MFSRQARTAWLRTRGMLALLLLLIVSAFVVPAVVAPGAAWRFATDVMLTLIVAIGVVAITDHRKLAVTLAALSVLVVAVRWSEWIIPTGLHPSVRDLVTICAFLVLGVAVGINVFGSGNSLKDRIFGAIVLYLLIGMVWAFAYAVVDLFLPQSFAGRSDASPDPADWVYFSFVTLTTVGYGDITPVHPAARVLAVAEALIGQLYPAILIGRLVSLQISSKQSGASREA